MSLSYGFPVAVGPTHGELDYGFPTWVVLLCRLWTKVAGEWKEAQAYVKVAGAWLAASVWEKRDGAWKKIT